MYGYRDIAISIDIDRIIDKDIDREIQRKRCIDIQKQIEKQQRKKVIEIKRDGYKDIDTQRIDIVSRYIGMYIQKYAYYSVSTASSMRKE